MTTLTKDITAKFAVAAVAVAMIFAAFAPSAQAQTTEDLQQMINDLLAQVAQLQAQIGGTTGGGSASDVCPYTWTRDLTMGSEGADVMKLQQFLNDTPDLRVAPAGSPGSAGMETMYYGPATAAAVSKMQVMFRAEVLTPGGLVDPTGYFGSMSRAKANDLCVADATTEEVDEAEEGAEDEDEDMDEEDDFELGGEANLDDFTVEDAEDDDVEEGDEDSEIGMFVVEFENGDAEISRIDLALLKSGETDTSTSEPWETFESISLWVDGDKIAEVNADDEDDYLDEDDGELRFSNLRLIAEEGEEIEIIVAASVQGNLATAELGNWNLFATGMRFFDADGVASTVDDEFDIDDTLSTSKAARFSVEVEGFGDEFDIRSSDQDRSATTLPLEDDENTEYVSFAFDLDAEDSDADIEVNEFTLTVDAFEPDGTTATSAALLVDDIVVLVDGNEVDTDDVTINSGTIRVEFDNEFYVDAGEEVTVEIEVEYKSLAASLEGATIRFSLDGSDVDAEGSDDVTTGGSATGDQHTLRSEGVILELDDQSFVFSAKTDATVDDDEGTYTLKYEVTAFEGDFYFNKTAASGTSATAGAVFQIEDSNGDAVASGTSNAVLSSNASTQGSRFVVREGDTKTFTLKVTYNPSTGNNGFYSLQLEGVNYYTDGVVGAPDTVASQKAIPSEDFETDPYEI